MRLTCATFSTSWARTSCCCSISSAEPRRHIRRTAGPAWPRGPRASLAHCSGHFRWLHAMYMACTGIKDECDSVSGTNTGTADICGGRIGEKYQRVPSTHKLQHGAPIVSNQYRRLLGFIGILGFTSGYDAALMLLLFSCHWSDQAKG
jgi:hypothetical protein